MQSKNSHKHAIGKRFPIQEICNSKKYLTGNKIFNFQTSHYSPQPYLAQVPPGLRQKMGNAEGPEKTNEAGKNSKSVRQFVF